jgi:hypothetical protein
VRPGRTRNRRRPAPQGAATRQNTQLRKPRRCRPEGLTNPMNQMNTQIHPLDPWRNTRFHPDRHGHHETGPVAGGAAGDHVTDVAHREAWRAVCAPVGETARVPSPGPGRPRATELRTRSEISALFLNGP